MAVRGNASVRLRGRMGRKPRAARCSHGELYAPVRSVPLSIAAARQVAVRIGRRSPAARTKRRCPSAAVLQIVRLTVQDVRNFSTRRLRAFAAANPPSEFQRSFVAPGRSVTRRERVPTPAKMRPGGTAGQSGKRRKGAMGETLSPAWGLPFRGRLKLFSGTAKSHANAPADPW